MLIDTEKLELGVYAVNPFEKERPLVLIDPNQLWFWSKEWLDGELQAEEDLKNGKYEKFDTMEDFVDSLKARMQ